MIYSSTHQYCTHFTLLHVSQLHAQSLYTVHTATCFIAPRTSTQHCSHSYVFHSSQHQYCTVHIPTCFIASRTSIPYCSHSYMFHSSSHQNSKQFTHPHVSQLHAPVLHTVNTLTRFLNSSHRYSTQFTHSYISWLPHTSTPNTSQTPPSTTFSVISLRPLHIPMHYQLSPHQYSTQHSFQATGCFHIDFHLFEGEYTAL